MKLALLIVCAAVMTTLVGRAATPAPSVVFTQRVMLESSGSERSPIVVLQYMSDGSVRWTRAVR